ncbi:AraC family transcriptional regulator [Methylobacterium platani]|uniref:AraC family transcriptional regulator n=1 Tax=Methylobacterium platani TaxID=427683 RepID=UPI00069F0248|nr:AraC family transcriptional regulator [Methylobacterium platani]
MGADLLDRLLVTLAVRLRSFSVCTIQRGWRLGFSPFEAITVHYVLRGTGSLRVGQGPWRSFAPHTIIVVPPRHSHSLGAAEDCVGEVRAEDHCVLHGDGLISFTAGDGSPDALFVCGQIADTHTGAMGLFELFQAPMVETFPSNAALRYAFELMLAEVQSPSLATQAMTEVLMKQCLIIMLRQQLAASDFTSPILLALQNPKLARAVLAVLEQPGAHYSVEGLAALAGMGRTSFAEGFAATFGQGPMEFVQRVRLRIASRLLSGTDLPVKVIAATVGYASRSAFSKAFEVEFGTAPSQFRMVGGMDEGEPERIESKTPDTEPT